MSDTAPVVVAYDGSRAADRGLEAVASLFREHPALVVTVWSSTVPAAPASLVALPAEVVREACDKLDDAARRQAARLAEGARDRLRAAGIDATATELLCHGTTWATIVHFAEEHAADAVVVGSRGRSPVNSALLGSVSNGVVHHCTRPVLVVHE